MFDPDEAVALIEHCAQLAEADRFYELNHKDDQRSPGTRIAKAIRALKGQYIAN